IQSISPQATTVFVANIWSSEPDSIGFTEVEPGNRTGTSELRIARRDGNQDERGGADVVWKRSAYFGSHGGGNLDCPGPG
ncbi:hypothetical protein T11_14555, partial [Trichinella zimbabwensis]